MFDRSQPLPTGGTLQQSDATSWMAMYSLNLLAMAMELAHDNPAYEDLASKFWEHFVYIGHAMGHQGKARASGFGMTMTASSTTACGSKTGRGSR